MAHDIDWHLIERWLAGESTPAEDAAVRAWLAADPQNQVFLETLRETLPLREPAPDDWDVERAWSRAAKTTGVAPPPLGPPIRLVPAPPQRRPSIPLRWLARAAVLALIVGGGLVVHRLALTDRATTTAVAPAAREFTTTRGQRIAVRFPDGTNVTLGPMSRLAIPEDYGAAERRVRLDGEAYFDVAHDDAKPFTVQARHAVARDLGTRFTVRAREGEADVRVVVTEGKVVLSAGAGSGAILGVRDLGRVDTTGTPRVTRGVNVDSYLAWMRGRLAFDQTPLADAAAEIGRWYDVQVSLGDAALRTRRLTIAFGDESLDQILDAIAFITHARYERSGKRVTFYSLQSTR